MVALHTGLRQGELLALRWEDLDLEAHTLQVRRTVTKDGGKLAVGPTKTAKGRRTVKLTKDAAASLRGLLTRQLEEIDVLGDHFQDQGLEFCTSKGTLTRRTYASGPSRRCSSGRVSPTLRFTSYATPPQLFSCSRT